MTIYALSTPPGVSGIAIIRLSGPNSLTIAKDIIHSTIDNPRMALLKNLYDSKKELFRHWISTVAKIEVNKKDEFLFHS